MTTVQKLLPRSQAAWDAFRERVTELGGEVLEPQWLGDGTPHRVRCSRGHECTPRPNNERKGIGICRTCAGQDPRAAETAFRARLDELGATLLEPQWLGANTPHRLRCAAGHECKPRPASLRAGRGPCNVCTGNDSQAAWNAFRVRVAESGGSVLEPAWLGANTRHRVRCAVGHDCMTLPASTRRGEGICRACAGKDPKSAEAAFRARVADLGGLVLESRWLGADIPHRVQCPAGHVAKPRPSDIRQGQGLCLTCVYGEWSIRAELAFRARVAELGGSVLEPEWLGNHVPHRVRCAAGHFTKTRPSQVQQGCGLCRHCRGMVWDAFYVVADDEEQSIKFGITSGDPRPRLKKHARDGFDRVIRLSEGLPGDLAPRLERAVLAALRDVRETPVRGREYFPARVLGLVLDVVDGWTTSPASVREPK